jgi:hypothetical protein
MARHGRGRIDRDGDLSQPENAWPLQHLVEAIANEVQARLLGQAGKNPADLNCATFAASPAPLGDGVVSESSIAAGKGSSPSPEEEPMYAWISRKPYKHHHKWMVWCGGLDGIKTHETFETESQAQEFIEKAKHKVLVGGGHPIGDLVDKYIDERTRSLRASSLKTIEFRLRTLARDRDRVPIEVFPWMKAWTQHAVTQSVDSQHGILSSARGFIDFCIKAGIIRRDPLIKVEISGHEPGTARTNEKVGATRFFARRGPCARPPGCRWSVRTRCAGCTARSPPGSGPPDTPWPRPWATPRSPSPSATTWTARSWRFSKFTLKSIRIAPFQKWGHPGLNLMLSLLTLLTVYWISIACVGGIAETISFHESLTRGRGSRSFLRQLCL